MSGDKNTVGKSNLNAGESIHVGDSNSTTNTNNSVNTTNIQVVTTQAVVISIFFAIAIFWIYHLYGKGITSEGNIAIIQEEITDHPVTYSTSKNIGTIKKDKQVKEETKKLQTINKEKNKITKLTIRDTPDKYKNIVKAGILKQVSKYNFMLNKRSEKNHFNREIKCSVQIHESEIEIGIRSLFKISFDLDIAYFLLPEEERIGGNTISSKEYKIYDKKEIPQLLKKWMEEIESSFFSLKSY